MANGGKDSGISTARNLQRPVNVIII